MLRLVKAWAGVHGLNDAAEGTFNSFALGLMVDLLTHLQPDHDSGLASGSYHEASFPDQPDSAPDAFAHQYLVVRLLPQVLHDRGWRHDVSKASL